MDTPNFSPDGLAGGAASLRAAGASYQEHASKVAQLIESKKGTWDGINAESVARMRLQNRFRTGLDIARYTASIMRRTWRLMMRTPRCTPSLWAPGTDSWRSSR